MHSLNSFTEEILQTHFQTNDIVVVGTLNWGLGHTTRCIPIIHWLTKTVRKVYIASDGPALELLKNEFPTLEHLELPSYAIHYKTKSIMYNILTSRILSAVINESKILKDFVQKVGATIILSDNRLGFRSSNLRNYYITHQYNIIASNYAISYIASKLHQFFIHKYDYCFIIDYPEGASICPKLSHTKYKKALHIGIVSRISTLQLPKIYDICVLLSGPEPQRTKLQVLLYHQLKELKSKRIVWILGNPSIEFNEAVPNNWDVIKLAKSHDVEFYINSSKLLVARCGYSTLMDIWHKNIMAILIPTPGQPEQKYLGECIEKKHNFMRINQNNIDTLLSAISTLTT